VTSSAAQARFAARCGGAAGSPVLDEFASPELDIVAGVVEEDSELPPPPVDEVLFVESWPPEEELVSFGVSLSAGPVFVGLVHDVRHTRSVAFAGTVLLSITIISCPDNPTSF
jgi:hypothetical protein